MLNRWISIETQMISQSMGKRPTDINSINNVQVCNIWRNQVIKEIANIEIKNYSEVEEFFKKNGCDMYDELYKINNFPGNIGGYADFTQTDSRPIENDEDKVECLIKIDSNLEHGIMIGDCGIIFSFISKEDIKSGNFENAIVDWDCC